MGGLLYVFFPPLLCAVITDTAREKCIIWRNTAEQCADFRVYANSHGHLQCLKNTHQIVISQLITNLIRIFKLKLSFLLLREQGARERVIEAGRESEGDSVSGNVITCNRQCSKHLLPLMSPL